MCGLLLQITGCDAPALKSIKDALMKKTVRCKRSHWHNSTWLELSIVVDLKLLHYISADGFLTKWVYLNRHVMSFVETNYIGRDEDTVGMPVDGLMIL